jgi:LysM repeat protein
MPTAAAVAQAPAPARTTTPVVTLQSPRQTATVQRATATEPPPQGGARYTVEAGDTLSALSRRFGVPVAELARLNSLPVDVGLRVGQQVSLPSGSWSDRLNIRVASPRPGATVSSPVVVEGTASVFENVVHITMLDSSGVVLAQTSERAASPDIGQHGAFRASLSIPDSARGRAATVQVFWTSPRDGSPADVVRIPISLATAN